MTASSPQGTVKRLLPLFFAAALAASPVAAQTGSGLSSQLGGRGGQSGLGGLGALGGGLANVGGAGLGNVAGLLGYCVRNRLLGSAGATAGAGGASGLLGKLTGRQGVVGSQDYLAGQQGIVSAGGSNLPIGNLGDAVKQQVCRTVLGRAKGLAGR